MEKITITLTRYNEPNWLIKKNLKSLLKQKNIKAKVMVLDQKKDTEIKLFCQKNSNKDITLQYINIPMKSLSYARNYALKNSETDILLYIDADALAERSWAFELTKTLNKKKVGIVGGKILPLWSKKPLIIAKSNIIQITYSLLDLGEGIKKTNYIIGANFGINKKNLKNKIWFNEKLGRQEGKLIGGEETAFCEELLKQGLKILYNGKAIVWHQIPPERISYKWLFNRFYYGGISKALMKKKPKTLTKEKNIWDVITLFIISVPYLAGYLYGILKTIKERKY